MPTDPLQCFWSAPAADVLSALKSSPGGLAADAARERLARVGPNVLGESKRSDVPTLLLRQFASPIVLLLIAAAVLSFAVRDAPDGFIVIGIVAVSGLLGFWQERGSARAVEKLLATVQVKATVLRDGREAETAVTEIVPGDVVLLSAGSSIPADCLLLAEQDLFVDEAALTGESFPVDKSPAPVPADAPLARRDNSLFLGTHVVSGSGRAVVVRTGKSTEFGAIAARLRVRPEETGFERGVRRFGYMLMEITLVLVIAIFAFNVYLHRPVLDSFLFALALAVGLTPQLLPAIISVNLASGARRMAAQKVIVKRLAAIENFGSMNVLCSDKTGTLTEGRVRVHAALDAVGAESERVLLYAFVNATFETAFSNPIDEAIRAHCGFKLDGWRKLDEVPYDFARKRLSVLAEHDGRAVLITKGALKNVLDVCTIAEQADGTTIPMATARSDIEKRYVALSAEGYRTLGVAMRDTGSSAPIDRDSEHDMVFLGMLALADPPKEGIAATVMALRQLGVRLKVITGDNALVAANVGAQVGLPNPKVLTGSAVRALSDEALPVAANVTDIFAEVEPNQKERIIRALRKAGHIVGYMGDGINDAPALHAADVSISVQEAVDVAKEAADIVLLETDLAVLEAGVREGRRTFANTLKYVFMASSANFGNMFSMAGASLMLPFLPLLPKQILLTNLLTDLPELTISSDRVDAEWIDQPRRWDIGFIRRFMLTFGLVSSVFDYLTFGVLIWFLRAGAGEFRTGWFVESVVSATMIVLVVRTRGSFFRSRPGRALLVTTLSVAAATLVIPYTPLGRIFGFVPLPPLFIGLMGLIVMCYIVSAELAKRWFYRKIGLRPVRMAP
jgi:Mg2+-importing ATPase